MWYKIPFLNYNNPQEIFAIFRYIYRVAASQPYRIDYTQNGVKIESQTVSIMKICEMAVIFVIIYYGQQIRFSMINPSDFVSYIGVVSQYNIYAISAFISAFIFLFTHSRYVKSLKIIMQVDLDFKKLGINFTYNYWFILFCSYTANLIFMPIMLNATQRTYFKMLIEVAAFFYPIIIRFAVMSKIIMTLGMLYEHFVKLNQCLAELEHEKYKDLRPDFVLNAATKIHEDLVIATNEINSGFTVIIFINMAGNVTQVVLALLFIYAGNYAEISPVELTIMFTLFTAQMAALYLLSYLIQQEAKDTLISLGLLNTYYFDNNLAIKKNTLLLQGLHHKIDLRVCSVLPLNLSIFGKQISICSTLFLLLVQYYSKRQTKTL